MDNRITFGLIGIAVGVFLLYWLFWPEVEVEYIIQKEYIDTSYVDHSEVVTFDSTIVDTLGDSIEYYKNMYKKELSAKGITIIEDGPYSVPLQRFKGFEPTLYGNISYSALVAGELLEMKIRQDLKLPTVTHRIEKKSRTVVHPKGLYLGAGINTRLSYNLSADYVNRDFLIGYYYDPALKNHGIRVAKKIF